MAVGRVVLYSFLCCNLVLLLSSEGIGVKLTAIMVSQWASRIGNEAFTFTKNVNGAKELEKAYENLPFSADDVTADDVLTEMKQDMEGFFSNKTEALKKLVDQAEQSYCKYEYNKNLKLSHINYPNAKYLDHYLNETGITLQYNNFTFQRKISFNKSVIHVPTDVYDGAAEIVNGISWTEALDTVFDANRHLDPSLSWQYFGSDKGFMRTYPARHWNDSPGQVDLYDARRRPWFIQGATSPKNVIILIDASGSMHGVPMRIAKLSAQNLIDTFGDNDFFNVVHFNSEAHVLCCKDEGPMLLQATKKNKIFAKGKLQEIKDSDVAVWKKGLEKAFDLLRKANNCALCQEVIMVLSDGTTSSLREVFEEQNKDKKVRLFTFAVGPPAESTQALHRMACENRGYFSRIQSVGAVREVSENYIRVLTRPMAMAPKEVAINHTVWTSVYLDASGLGMMVTGTLPVFHRIKDSTNCATKDGMQEEEKNRDHFLGVMATDVPLNYLQKFILQPQVGPNGYVYAINNNGMIITHPRLKTVYGYLLDPPGVDLTDVEPAVNTADVLKLRTSMIKKVPLTVGSHSSGVGSQSFEVFDLSPDELRVVKRTLRYYFDGLEGTSFSLGMATPQTGYKYRVSGSSSQLKELLIKTHHEDIDVERWPYCPNMVFSQSKLVEQLINEAKANNFSLCNKDLINGLLVDLNMTHAMPSVWSSKSSNYSQKKIKNVFVRTFFGLTRSLSFSRDSLGHSSQGDFFARVVGSKRSDSSIIYTSPFIPAKSERNASSVFVYQKISHDKRPMAVLGYEMDMESFTSELFVKHTECNSSGEPECDLTCNRTGENAHGGLYCYLLDENGFVVAANDENSAGKFFGRVDAPVMARLIRDNGNSKTEIYNKVVLTDFQAVCEEKAGVNSAGTSFILKPFFSLSSYVDWWTSKAVWSLLYFNFYSWIFAKNSAVTEAADDVPKNVSCVKNITTYYATNNTNIREIENSSCEGCVRAYAVSSVPMSNLFLVVIDGICGQCPEPPGDMGIPGEPIEISLASVKKNCEKPGYRKRPKRCFNSTAAESGYPCGFSHPLKPSLLSIVVFAVLLQVFGPL